MYKWDDGDFEIRYFYDDKCRGLAKHRYMFNDGLDFIDKYYDDCFMDDFHRTDKKKISSFRFPVRKGMVHIAFIKTKRMFGRAKITIKIVFYSFLDESIVKMSKGLKVKNHSKSELNDSKSELNEWINKALEEIESNET